MTKTAKLAKTKKILPQQEDLSKGILTDHDIYLFKEGTHFRLYEKLGAHIIEQNGVKGTHFAVWAPNAKYVSVIGDFNGWSRDAHPLHVRWDESGIWHGFVPGVKQGAVYKYFIVSGHNDYEVEKRDPFAFSNEVPPQTASLVWDLDYQWKDSDWMKQRREKNKLDAPMSIYELHLGSWRRSVENNDFLSYDDIAKYLVDYIKDMGFTHVEFLPVMEHPFYGSWGYQSVGYFSPTVRYGDPQACMRLIDQLHQNDIGVILDWVPSHFPSDEHGLVYFDGTHLFEHSDPRQGFHPDWKSYIFNHGRKEISEFLISSAVFWLDKYHADGLRVDAVASMLYLDYSREEGEWIPNKHGGRENLDSMDFLKSLNETVYSYYPDVQMTAEESTAWPGVSKPTSVGGLGFGMKWNMGWMHDVLEYFKQDPINRKYHHNELTFSYMYTFSENYTLSLSHDEVVHGKGSMLNKMPGDDWQKFANMRLLYGYMYAHPGKKLMFMGGEIGQWSEWNHDQSLDWHLLEYAPHQGLQRWIKDLNHCYRNESALFQNDFSEQGFQPIETNDWEQGVISFQRIGHDPLDRVIVVCNLTPVVRHRYKVGVPENGYWKEILNSDADLYGGSGVGNMGGVQAVPVPFHQHYYSVALTLPPLAMLILKQT